MYNVGFLSIVITMVASADNTTKCITIVYAQKKQRHASATKGNVHRHKGKLQSM